MSLGAGAVGGLLLGLSHGFLLVPLGVAGALVGLGLVLRRELRRTILLSASIAAALTVAAPFLLRLSAEQSRFEHLQGHGFPARPSDEWWTWVIGAPLLTALTIAGIASYSSRRRSPDAAVWLTGAWLLVHGTLIFLPVTVFQRRYSEGISLPAGLLAGAAAARLVRGRRPLVRVALAALVVAPSVSLGLLYGRRSLTVDPEEARLLSTLRDEDVVLAGYDLSWRLPAVSSATSYLGRDVETLHYARKLEQVKAFVGGAAEPDARSWFASSGITAIVVDSADASLDPPADTSCFASTRVAGRFTVLRPIPDCFARGGAA